MPKKGFVVEVIISRRLQNQKKEIVEEKSLVPPPSRQMLHPKYNLPSYESKNSHSPKTAFFEKLFLQQTERGGWAERTLSILRLNCKFVYRQVLLVSFQRSIFWNKVGICPEHYQRWTASNCTRNLVSFSNFFFIRKSWHFPES